MILVFSKKESARGKVDGVYRGGYGYQGLVVFVWSFCPSKFI